MADPAPTTFDPSRYITKLQGRDYLEVKWRLVWLRNAYPDATIDTELKTNEPDEAVFKATIQLPTGGRATGWGSETSGDFRDYLEKAETKALGRALAALGFGTQFCEDHDFDANASGLKVVDSPVDFASTKGRRVATQQPAVPPQAGTQDITERQLAFLRAIAREAGLNEDDLDLESERTYGRRASGLSRRDASALIESLQARRGAIDTAFATDPVPFVDASTGEILAEAREVQRVPVIEGFTQLWPVLRKHHAFRGARKELEEAIGPFGDDDAQAVYDRYLAHVNGGEAAVPDDWKAASAAFNALSGKGKRIKDHDELKLILGRMYPDLAGVSTKEIAADDLRRYAAEIAALSDDELAGLLMGGN